MFCGEEGERTIFNITCLGGGLLIQVGKGGGIFSFFSLLFLCFSHPSSMQAMSAVETEEEVLLRAGTRFVVKSVLKLGPGLTQIQVFEHTVCRFIFECCFLL